MKEAEMSRVRSMQGGNMKCTLFFISNPERKKLLGKPGFGWEDNSNMGVK
jgi:hypothetical protein